MNLSNPQRMSRRIKPVQFLLGMVSRFTLSALYLRRVHGLEKLDPARRCIYVSNHVSLLDTFLLGSLFWRRNCYPIVVLGDKAVWSTSRLKRALSAALGFLLDRGKLNPARIEELKTFGRAASHFQLVVFPEGTRGNGVDVAVCQPGIYHIAREAAVPIVPLFIANMQLVSTKAGQFHFLAGVRKVEIHCGDAIEPETYLPLSREELTSAIRNWISGLRPIQKSAEPALVPAAQIDAG
ncbi:MAG TPA: lysophospholipid acyltransferase family protein [Verrucomicrobiae bacterium]|nr:lysophospholipid acyltransferase family protein [Verrucomicrobiae bacterium]